MKKVAFIAVIALALASCGGASNENCTDCNTDSTAVADTTAATADTVNSGGTPGVTPVK
jgi:hypothetical protein